MCWTEISFYDHRPAKSKKERNTWRKRRRRQKKRGKNRLPVQQSFYFFSFLFFTFPAHCVIKEVYSNAISFILHCEKKTTNNKTNRMDRRYSSSSATETAKKASIGNALNGSIRFRNGLSSDSTVSSSNHHRKSFPSTSDVGSSFNSTTQVITFLPCHLSFTFDISPAARIPCPTRDQ